MHIAGCSSRQSIYGPVSPVNLYRDNRSIWVGSRDRQSNVLVDFERSRGWIEALSRNSVIDRYLRGERSIGCVVVGRRDNYREGLGC